MTSPTIKIFAILPQLNEIPNVSQSFEKRDSQGVSIFQAIGISYSILDRMIGLDAGCARAAAEFFVNTLMKDGWSWDTALLLVKEADWKRRMYRVWHVINAQNRADAVALDYEVYQNYWPNRDFCADGFEAETACWIADPLDAHSAS
ncbi:hypothetical protein [Pseudomonas fluorescens]|uniref:Uncharacterized protein n=1 Tax=Pseudomonas fluorescens TaxID=294 RepID=A0AAE2A7X9_PSEFL|nr:hypothetical protein [Pseudomonas fluorescens]KIF60341.1 hypothetical protein QS95_12640 [Pseudomonas fluorescens]